MLLFEELRILELNRFGDAEGELDHARRLADEAATRANELAVNYDALLGKTKQRMEALSLVEKMQAEADNRGAPPPYRDKNQEDAMREALLKHGIRMSSIELVDALKQGGYEFASGNPPNSVNVAANGNRKGYFRIEKEGNRSMIALAEWPERAENLGNDDDIAF